MTSREIPFKKDLMQENTVYENERTITAMHGMRF